MIKLNLKCPDQLKVFHNSGKISARFRNINIALFLVFSALIGAVLFSVINNITDTVSKDYARLYSTNTAGTLNTYLSGEIALITKAAHSSAVVNWLEDEDNQAKKLAAYEEMMGILGVLSSDNLYIGVQKTLHEFSIEENSSINDFETFAKLQANNTVDAWYFDCIASQKEYLLNVDIDKIFNRKRVWLNYKVTHNNNILGVLCAGLDFSALVEKLFADYDSKNIRSVVMDEKGIIHMDSALLGNRNFLQYSSAGENHIENELSDPNLIAAVNEHLKGIDEYFKADSKTSVIKLANGEYHYATIAPIASTTWSVITLYNSSSLFDLTKLLPLIITMLAMFIAFIAATSITSTRLIFAPFEKLMSSIARIKVNMHEHVYGTDRSDEIGDLANTVHNMRGNLIEALSKVHYDALTGIYNRRFMEEAMSRIVKTLSRSQDMLSVIMIDIDFFKKYNDTYGHLVGDDCLKTVARALFESVVRADDFVARYGGEEFIAVLPNTNEKGAQIVADRLLANVRACNIPHTASDAASYVTISIGITTGRVHHTKSGENYIKRADEALYMSKKNGRDRYTFLEF